MNRTLPIVLLPFGLTLAGCAEPAHLQRGFGTAYHEALTRQADLDRPTASDATSALTGEEGLALRRRVADAVSDEARISTVGEIE